MEQKIGSLAFIVGVAIAILSGFFVQPAAAKMIVTTLLVLGFIVGLLNVTPSESTGFLVATIALMVAISGLRPALIMVEGLAPKFILGATFHNIITNLLIFIAPAAVVVAFKEIYRLAAEK